MTPMSSECGRVNLEVLPVRLGTGTGVQRAEAAELRADNVVVHQHLHHGGDWRGEGGPPVGDTAPHVGLAPSESDHTSVR